MLDITGAGAQLPMRSHWKLRPGPQSHKNSEQQCKRIRASTATANGCTVLPATIDRAICFWAFRYDISILEERC